MDTTDTASDADGPPRAEERARQSVEHLQAAARELIQAARAALDVAEEVVADPEALVSLAGALSTMGDLARRATGASARARGAGGPGPGGSMADDDTEPRVTRITVA